MAVATDTIATDTYCHQYLLPPVATAIDATDENAVMTTFSASWLSSCRRKATYSGVGRGRGGGRGGGGGGKKGAEEGMEGEKQGRGWKVEGGRGGWKGWSGGGMEGEGKEGWGGRREDEMERKGWGGDRACYIRHFT